MKIGKKLMGATVAVLITAEASAQCTGGPATRTHASSLEYAEGQPKSVEVTDGFKTSQLSYIKSGTRAIFEGDIVIANADQLEFAAQAGPVFLYRQDPNQLTPFGLVAKSVLFGSRKWSGNTVPFAIDPVLLGPDLVLKAMKAWSDITKIKFVERTAANAVAYPNFVYFTQGSDPNACLSEGLGMMGGKQNVELVQGCEFGQIVHEIGHVLGLDHEQNRADRDAFVRVETQNILAGYGGQFAQRPSRYKDMGSYDFDSIMHYEPNAFTCNGKPTIMPIATLPPGVQVGQRTHISAGDAAVINSIYK